MYAVFPSQLKPQHLKTDLPGIFMDEMSGPPGDVKHLSLGIRQGTDEEYVCCRRRLILVSSA